jgi:hypothetical protein
MHSPSPIQKAIGKIYFPVTRASEGEKGARFEMDSDTLFP